MRRNSIVTRITAGRFFRTAVSLFIGVAVTGFALWFFSLLLMKIDNARTVAPVISLAALCAGAYFAARYYASRRRKRGLLTGLACGALCYCAVYIAGAVTLGAVFGLGFFARLTAAAVCGAIGGIKGVNSKRKYRPMRASRHR